MSKLIILEDELAYAQTIKIIAKKVGFSEVLLYENLGDIVNDYYDKNILKDASVFITDFNLPDGDSTFILKLMKSNGLQTPTLLNSANPSAILEMKKNNVDDLIVCNLEKSASPNELTEILKKYL